MTLRVSEVEEQASYEMAVSGFSWVVIETFHQIGIGQIPEENPTRSWSTFLPVADSKLIADIGPKSAKDGEVGVGKVDCCFFYDSREDVIDLIVEVFEEFYDLLQLSTFVWMAG